MKIELTIKSAKIKQLTEEEKYDKEVQRLTSDYREPTNDLMTQMKNLPLEFSYTSYIIDSEDIASSMPYDKEHTLVSVYDGENILVKMTWILWKAFYEYVTGQRIINIQELPPEKRYPPLENAKSRKRA